MRRVLAVVALLLTAGCLGGVPLADGGLAPAASDGYPPGVTERGVENATALVLAHLDAVRDTGWGFRVETASNYTDTIDGEPFVTNETTTYRGRTTGTTTRVRSHALTRATRTFGERSYAFDTWWSESTNRQLRRVENAAGTVSFEVREYVDIGPPDRYPPWTLAALQLLGTGDYEVTRRVVRDGRTLLVLEATAADAEHDHWSAFDGRLVVDLQGRIHEFEGHGTGSKGEASWVRTADYELTELGVSSVPRPSWEDAAEAATRAGLSVELRERSVVVTHQEGEPLPAGSTVEVTRDGETHALTLDRELAAGERAFLAFPREGAGPVLRFQQPGEDYARITDPLSVQVFGPHGYAVDGVGAVPLRPGDEASS